jgi:formin 2
LKGLKEYLADADERRGFIAFMKNGESSQDVKDKLYADLSQTEKYMVTMMEVPDVAAKFDAVFFRTVFKNRFEDITASIRTLNSACDELRSSKKLRKLMAMILTVVNEINTGGEGKMAMGFTLDALLKLNEVGRHIFCSTQILTAAQHFLLQPPRLKLLTGRLVSFITW